MKLTFAEDRRVNTFLKRFASHDKVQEMNNYVQHGRISTYDHCASVTRTSYWLSRRLHLHINEDALLTGAFLHDFYLYDWHHKDKSHRLHGYRHPDTACKNAKKYFHISSREEEIIRSHMWPLTLTRVPRSREAMIVCIADKYVSAIETLACR